MQKFMIFPVGASSFKEAMKMGVEIYHNLKEATMTHQKLGGTQVPMSDKRCASAGSCGIHQHEPLPHTSSAVVFEKGTFCTVSAPIITEVIGSGVLSLAWATTQLGWLMGSGSLVIFSSITFHTSNLLVDCYRT